MLRTKRVPTQIQLKRRRQLMWDMAAFGLGGLIAAFVALTVRMP